MMWRLLLQRKVWIFPKCWNKFLHTFWWRSFSCAQSSLSICRMSAPLRLKLSTECWANRFLISWKYQGLSLHHCRWYPQVLEHQNLNKTKRLVIFFLLSLWSLRAMNANRIGNQTRYPRKVMRTIQRIVIRNTSWVYLPSLHLTSTYSSVLHHLWCSYSHSGVSTLHTPCSHRVRIYFPLLIQPKGVHSLPKKPGSASALRNVGSSTKSSWSWSSTLPWFISRIVSSGYSSFPVRSLLPSRPVRPNGSK